MKSQKNKNGVAPEGQLALPIFEIYQRELGKLRVELPTKLLIKLQSIRSHRFSRMLHAILMEVPHEREKDQQQYVIPFEKVFHFKNVRKPSKRRQATEEFDSLLKNSLHDNILELNKEESAFYLNLKVRKHEMHMISSISYGENNDLLVTLDLNFKRIISNPEVRKIIGSSRNIDKLSKTDEYLLHWKICEAQNAGLNFLEYEVEELGEMLNVGKSSRANFAEIWRLRLKKLLNQLEGTDQAFTVKRKAGRYNKVIGVRLEFRTMAEILEEYNKAQPYGFEQYLVECNFQHSKLVDYRNQIDKGSLTENYVEHVILELYKYFDMKMRTRKKNIQNIFAYVYHAIESDIFKVGKTTEAKILMPDIMTWKEVVDYIRPKRVRARGPHDFVVQPKAIETTAEVIRSVKGDARVVRPPQNLRSWSLKEVFDLLDITKEERILVLDHIDRQRLTNQLYYIETNLEGADWKVEARKILLDIAREESKSRVNSEDLNKTA
jgi:hypothetical protein